MLMEKIYADKIATAGNFMYWAPFYRTLTNEQVVIDSINNEYSTIFLNTSSWVKASAQQKQNVSATASNLPSKTSHQKLLQILDSIF